MEFSKPSFKFFVGMLVGIGAVSSAYAADTQTCLTDGKIYFNNQQYDQAKQQFSKCVKNDPNNPETYLSLGGTLLRLNDLSGAQTQFHNALKKMEPDSPYASYVYSMLGDIALKQQNNAQALGWYNKSLSVGAANVNSLVGKGILYENEKNYKEAAAAYESALSFEPANLVARKRLINLEPYYFTDNQIATALLQRSAFPPTAKPQITQKERDLFRHIHQAEQRRGTDYLKNKIQKLPQGYVETLYKDTPLEREILTYTGYQTLQKYLGQDAVAAFEKQGVPTKEIFTLRDLKGENVFDEQGFLTDGGYYAYLQTVNGKKAFLLPYEDLPPSDKDLQRVERIAQRLKDQGYMEISRTEYTMLTEVTQCSADTLKNSLDVRTVPITKHRLRYFIQTETTPDHTPLKTVPYYYVMTERAKKNPSVKVPRNEVITQYKIMGYSEICLSDGDLLLQED